MTRAVFFDVDFTLIYPGPVFQGQGYREFCARHGIGGCDPAAFGAAVSSASALLDDSDDHVYDAGFFIRYIRHIIEQMGGSGPAIDACAEEIYREWAACHHFALYDDALPALRALRGTRAPDRPDLEHPPVARRVPEPLRTGRADRRRGGLVRARLQQAAPEHLPDGAATAVGDARQRR